MSLADLKAAHEYVLSRLAVGEALDAVGARVFGDASALRRASEALEERVRAVSAAERDFLRLSGSASVEEAVSLLTEALSSAPTVEEDAAWRALAADGWAMADSSFGAALRRSERPRDLAAALLHLCMMFAER